MKGEISKLQQSQDAIRLKLEEDLGEEQKRRSESERKVAQLEEQQMRLQEMLERTNDRLEEREHVAEAKIQTVTNARARPEKSKKSKTCSIL